MGMLGDISPQASVAIGIIVGLLSTSIQSLGLTLQRKSHLLEDDKFDPETRRPPYKRRRWQLGMLMFVVSNLVGSTIQITTLPLPVLSTLQASGLVFNTAFATLLLKEPFTRFSFLGTILTCSGAGLIAAFGAIPEPAHSLQQLLDLLQRKPFVVWMAGTLVVALGTVVLTHVLKVLSSYQHMNRHVSKYERPRSASSSKANAIQRRMSFSGHLPRPLQLRLGRLRLARGLAYALISGILSAHSLLMAKSAVELLVRTIIDHNNQFNRFQSWLILVALIFFALSQLYYLHLGLRLCSTSVLYPFVFCIYNIIAILDGLIYFHQTSRLSTTQGILIAVGTVILLGGVLALSWRLDDAAPAEPAPPTSMPQTPLTPGMGLIGSPDESDERSSLLSDSMHIDTSVPVGERTALLGKRSRAHTVNGYPQTPGSATREIWAELGDEEDVEDFLASLPRSPTLTSTSDRLEVAKRRRRGGSIPTAKVGRGSPSPSTSRSRYARRSQTLQAYGQASREIPAVKVSSDDDEDIDPRSTKRTGPRDSSETARSTSSRVHFAEQDVRSESRRSRWDAGQPPPPENKGKQNDSPG